MKRTAVALMAVMLSAEGQAQVPAGAPPIPAKPASLEELLRDKIGQEVLLGVSCQAGQAALKGQLEVALARIKELEGKASK